MYPDASAFNVYQNIPGDEKSLQSNITHGSFKDDEGNIWAGTSKALECIDALTHKVSQYHFFDPRLKDPVGYSVMSVLPHNANSCWVGTWGAGMQLFDRLRHAGIALGGVGVQQFIQQGAHELPARDVARLFP